MSKTMPVSNNEFYRKTQEYNEKYDFGFDDYECRCYANFFAALDEFSGHTMTYDYIVGVWLLILDVLNGKEPGVMINPADSYRDIVRVLMRFTSIKDIPFEDMQLFAFCFYYLFFTGKLDDNGEPVSCLDEFGDTDFIRREFEHEKTFKEKLQIEPLKSDETADDFGLVITNPVEVNSIEAEYVYLECLRFEDGSPIEIGRIKSYRCEKYRNLIDMFEILRDGEHVTDIYLYGYGIKSSFKAPKGFVFNAYDPSRN